MSARCAPVPMGRAPDARIPDGLLVAPDVSDAAVRLYACLAQEAVRGVAWARQAALAARLGWSRRKVGRALADLVAAGWVVHAPGTQAYVLPSEAREDA